jgi:hypothetical protein
MSVRRMAINVRPITSTYFNKFLEVFLLDENVANELKLEKALVHLAIKSKDLERWSVA